MNDIGSYFNEIPRKSVHFSVKLLNQEFEYHEQPEEVSSPEMITGVSLKS